MELALILMWPQSTVGTERKKGKTSNSRRGKEYLTSTRFDQWALLGEDRFEYQRVGSKFIELVPFQALSFILSTSRFYIVTQIGHVCVSRLLC